MAIPLKNKIWSGYFIAFLFIALSYFLIFVVIKKLDRESDRVARSYVVMNKLEELRGAIIDAETGARGYVITKDKRFLQPYTSAVASISPVYSQLSNLIADNNEQRHKFDTLQILMNRRLQFMSEGLQKFEANHFVITDEMQASREPSKNTMDSIRLYVHKMKMAEELLMDQRKNKLSAFFSNIVAITVYSLIIALITLIYSLIIYDRARKAGEKAELKSIKYRMDLENSVNELKQTNIELKELKGLEKFTATGRIARTIAHEVRNPLTNIALAAEQLQEMAAENEDSKLLLEMISRNSNRINQLVSELLNATRFVQLEFRSTDINQLINETLELAKDRIELSHIQVQKQFSGQCRVSVDVDKMKFALLNIILNAVEAMEKDKGLLLLKTKTEGKKCIIEISDNGIGMDEETQQKLFEPYFTSKTKGNGLGLTNTQNIILNHGGSIIVNSQIGKGSSFFIILDHLENEEVTRWEKKSTIS